MKHTLINGLSRAIDLEKILMDYYKEAHLKGRTPEIAREMQRLEDSHFVLVGRLKSQKERLERANGEGMFGNALQSLGHAIVDTVAGLPVSAIHGETNPTYEMLIRHEEQLRAHYEGLMSNADPETASLLETGIETASINIQHLESLRQFSH